MSHKGHGGKQMEARIRELVQRVKSMRERVEALEAYLPGLTVHLKPVLADFAEIESRLAEPISGQRR